MPKGTKVHKVYDALTSKGMSKGQKRLMTMSFAQNVGSKEMKSCLEKVRGMLVDIKPGFRLLTDLSSLESVATSCATDLGDDELVQWEGNQRRY